MKVTLEKNPSWRWGTLLIVALSLSIGWGIRGNFGHEDGAAFAGCLAAITVALMSGREDWRNRVAYFAFFGALGWGLGGTQSYMQVIAYAQSGEALSQWYGYFCLFIMGFLWAGMGSIGTAFPAVAPMERIVRIFKPLLFIFAAWLLLDIIEDPISNWLEPNVGFDTTWYRHENPLYWFDSNYLSAFFALFGLGIYDLQERHGEKNRLLLPVFAVAGSLVGFGTQFILRLACGEDRLASAVTYLQGDPTYINPTTGQQAYAASDLLNNWPQFFGDYPQHIGWLIGLVAGITIYFLIYGKFRNGASLFAYMAGGFLILFLAFPVLGSNLFTRYGGLRMTPPRSDNWAGMLGIFIGASVWLWRNDLRPVAWASVIGGTIGGLGFAGAEWLKTIMISFGNSKILAWKGILPGTDKYNSITSAWSNWQSQNWHSFFEQSYGFINGIAIAVALGLLASRIKMHKKDELAGQVNDFKYARWTKVFATLFVIFGITYFNVVENVDTWSQELNHNNIWQTLITLPGGATKTVATQWDFPYIGRLPGIDFLHMSPTGWFNLSWFLLVAASLIIVRRHMRQSLSIIPKTSLSKGQLIFIIFLWIMIVANFERALPGFNYSRLLTEWVIYVNAVITTVLVLILPVEKEDIIISEPESYKKHYQKSWILLIAAIFISSLFFTVTNRLVYHYPPSHELDLLKSNADHTRFGTEADWRSKPNLKNSKGK
ncbi:MAG: hypothetical protein Q8891_08690 [Bacteroidota bacterium]|nr:hypothetical protein [Bacteroidota bacterium]